MVDAGRTHALASWLFLRLLGIVYFAAFASLFTQVLGLVGHEGILPAPAYMDAIRAFVADQHIGLDRFRLFPTLTWLNASDTFLRGMCAAGMAGAVMLTAGVGQALVAPVLWLLYLTLTVAGQDFMSYQWDALLLESGFLAVLLTPSLRKRPLVAVDPPRIAVWLFLWLVFRLMFGSGAVKLTSGDPAWRSLTALGYHFETQPIPTPVAWYAHLLPAFALKAATAFVFAIELGAPVLMLVGRRWPRLIAFIVLVGLQALIALTGNYAFFNLLSASLCVFLLPDDLLASVLTFVRVEEGPKPRVRRIAAAIVAIVTVPASIVTFAGSFGLAVPGGTLLFPITAAVEPFQVVNGYGLFAVMTTKRPEIIVEGSNDGDTWRPYEFKYKAGDLRRRPPWVAPHQPRLDWQMWFASLSRIEDERWFGEFCRRLLEASPDVLRLLDRDPFDGSPPRYVRAIVYDYHFSTWDERRTKRQWWVRDGGRAYSPTFSLRADRTLDSKSRGR
jgi:hypothetical protein